MIGNCEGYSISTAPLPDNSGKVRLVVKHSKTNTTIVESDYYPLEALAVASRLIARHARYLSTWRFLNVHPLQPFGNTIH